MEPAREDLAVFFPLLLATLAWPQHSKAAPAFPPSALVIIGDDIATIDHDAAPTPNLDQLAAGGHVFTRGYACPTCNMTRRALLFGRWSIDGSGNSCEPAGAAEPPLAWSSLAELRRDFPAAIAGKWHLGGDPLGGPWECAPLSHGFEVWLAGSAANVDACGGNGYFDWLEAYGCTSSFTTEYEPELVFRQATSWWTSTVGPRLLVVAPNLAHTPFHAPPPEFLPPGYPTPVTKFEKYRAMIVALDTFVGQLLESVDLEETLVFYVGDNGTPPSVTPFPYTGKSKGTVYERGIHVPFLVAGPGVVPGSSDDLVHVVDLFATLRDYWGKPPAGDGISLRPALEGTGSASHEYVLCGNPAEVCARSAHYKLRRQSSGAEQFFDLDLDPLEETDRLLDPAYALEVDAHRAWLDAHLP